MLGRMTVLGALGVLLFFLVSGSVIVLSVAGRSPAQYLGSRIGRLYPAYWAAVPAAALLMLLLRWTSPRRLLVLALLWPAGGALLKGLTARLGAGQELVGHMLFPEYSALFAAGTGLSLLHRHGHTPGRWAAVGGPPQDGPGVERGGSPRRTVDNCGNRGILWIFASPCFRAP